MMGQLWNRLQLLCAQGVGLLIGQDKIQARVLDGEPLHNLARVEPYGFSYRPLPGCETYLFFPAGDRSYGVALVIGDKRYQMDLADGEVALHDDAGNCVHLQRGGTIYVKAATQVFADTPLFKTSGNAEIGGNLVVHGTTQSHYGYVGAGGGIASMQGGLYVLGPLHVNGRNVSDTHRHNTPAGLSDEVI